MTDTAIRTTAFHANIRQTQGGLCQGSNGDGLIIAFDVPETEVTPELLSELMKLRRADLIVTVMRADDVKGQSLLSPESPQDDDEKSNSGQPERKNGAPAQRKGRQKTPKADSRTVEQQTNGDAWSRLLHRTPEFLACPGVREVILEHSLAEDEHAAMRAEFNVEHLSDVDEDAALTRFIAPNAQHHIRAAWRAARAKIEARIGKRDNR